MGRPQICMLITWNIGSPSQPYNRKRGLLKYEIISSVVWFTLRDAARDTAVYSTRAIHRLGIIPSNLRKVFIIYMKFPNLYFIYTEMYKDCSCLRFLGLAQPERDQWTQWSDRAHLSSVHPMASISPDTLPRAAFVRQHSRGVEFSISPLKPDGEQVPSRSHVSRGFPTRPQQTHRQEKENRASSDNFFLLVGLWASGLNLNDPHTPTIDLLPFVTEPQEGPTGWWSTKSTCGSVAPC